MAKVLVIKKLITKDDVTYRLGRGDNGCFNAEGQEMVCEKIQHRSDGAGGVFKDKGIDEAHYTITCVHSMDPRIVECIVIPQREMKRLFYVEEIVAKEENNPEANVKMEKG